ncbi:hypothetical protein [Helicobacter pylori]|uniref:hypothetical protein n=1 Tax=Helicobacter pylori TaxID=210 RepID=UPI0011C3DF7A|nr:hypothetical protein [Helicobacter pylori]
MRDSNGYRIANIQRHILFHFLDFFNQFFFFIRPNFNPDKRETYGFLVLELMSDREYEAFLRATAGMDESQKRS